MYRLSTDRFIGLPRLVRLSVGSAVVLGLLEGKLNASPSTAYLMTYKKGKCLANCGFCSQARESKSGSELLSRVSWPTFPACQVVERLEAAFHTGKIGRVCIQALNYASVFDDLSTLVQAIKSRVAIPVSVSCQPKNEQDIARLHNSGVDRIGIALDASTEELFKEIKGSRALGPYEWNEQFRKLREAVAVFGEGNVSTHLIAGLGETEQELLGLVQKIVDMGVLPALFAFTPIRGTRCEGFPQPAIDSYRRVQLARHLIVTGLVRQEDMRFNSEGKTASFAVDESLLNLMIDSGMPFLTSGCPDCNRPFYNEKPSGPLYNYPRSPTLQEIESIRRSLRM